MEEYKIIKKPIHSEKSVYDRENNNTYYFEVHNKANKIEIKKAMKNCFPLAWSVFVQ